MSTLIFNVNDWPAGFQLKYIPRIGHKVVPARKAGESYASIVVEDAHERLETINPDDPFMRPIPSLDIARDLLRIGEEDDSLRYGLGIAASAEPTEQELLDATNRMRHHQELLVEQADRLWLEKKDPKLISGHARWALAAMGLNREWGSTTGKTARCGYCGTAHPNDVAICASCKNIVNPERHAELKAREKAAKVPVAASKQAEG